MPYSKELKYNPEIWADMSLDERSTYYIYEAYQKFMRNRGDSKKYLSTAEAKSFPHPEEGYPADKIRNHKNWAYFTKVWERFKHDQAFDTDIFMESIAKHLPKSSCLYPAQLSADKYFKGYIEYRKSLKIRSHTDDIKRVMSGIVQTHKLISRRVGSKELSLEQLYNFFNKPKDNNILSEGLLLCIQEMISPYYFAVSRSFLAAYRDSDIDIREEILEIDRLKDMAMLVKAQTRVYSFVKKIFGEDII